MSGGRPKKYTSRKKLQTAVDAYFRSISIETTARDRWNRPVKNVDGEEIRVIQYAEPPTKTALCLFLGIDRRTWQNYADIEQHPEFAGIAEEVNARIEAYLERELLTREKSVQGIIFNLQNNYNWKAKSEVEMGARTRAAMAAETPLSERREILRQIARDFAEDAEETNQEPGGSGS